MLFDTLAKLRKELNIEFEFVNIGGGLGIPYKPTNQDTVDVGALVEKLHHVFKTKKEEHSISDGNMPRLYMENGMICSLSVLLPQHA